MCPTFSGLLCKTAIDRKSVLMSVLQHVSQKRTMAVFSLTIKHWDNLLFCSDVVEHTAFERFVIQRSEIKLHESTHIGIAHSLPNSWEQYLLFKNSACTGLRHEFCGVFQVLFTVTDCVCGTSYVMGLRTYTVRFKTKLSIMLIKLQKFLSIYRTSLLIFGSFFFFTAFKIRPSASQFFAFSSEHLN